MKKQELWNSVACVYPREAFRGESYNCFVAGYNGFGDLAYEVATCNLATSPKKWNTSLQVTHWIEAFPPNALPTQSAKINTPHQPSRQSGIF